MLITLAEKACVIVLIGYIVSRAPFMRSYVEDRPPSLRSHLLLGIIFGLFSIYGTLSGVHLLGAVVNTRDTGPMIAGLFGQFRISSCATRSSMSRGATSSKTSSGLKELDSLMSYLSA